jgi:hypothetical protein
VRLVCKKERGQQEFRKLWRGNRQGKPQRRRGSRQEREAKEEFWKPGGRGKADRKNERALTKSSCIPPS